jgi:hypothetical protein
MSNNDVNNYVTILWWRTLTDVLDTVYMTNRAVECNTMIVAVAAADDGIFL